MNIQSSSFLFILEKEGSIIKTDNNLGLLTIDLETMQNTLLMGTDTIQGFEKLKWSKNKI